MVPGHTDPIPRPKGFERRNWRALALIGMFIACALSDALYSPAIADTEYWFAANDGYLAFRYLQHPGRSYGFCSVESYEWGSFSLGKTPIFLRDEGTMTIAIPLWMPLSCL